MFEISLSNAAELIASIRIHVNCRNLNIRAEQPFIPASALTTHLTLFENAMKPNQRNRIPMNKQRPILLFVILALAATMPFSIAQQSQGDAERYARQAASARAIPTFDPGWEEDEFPPHAVSLKTPEEINPYIKPVSLDARTRQRRTPYPSPSRPTASCTSRGRVTALPLPDTELSPRSHEPLVSSSLLACTMEVGARAA